MICDFQLIVAQFSGHCKVMIRFARFYIWIGDGCCLWNCQHICVSCVIAYVLCLQCFWRRAGDENQKETKQRGQRGKDTARQRQKDRERERQRGRVRGDPLLFFTAAAAYAKGSHSPLWSGAAPAPPPNAPLRRAG